LHNWNRLRGKKQVVAFVDPEPAFTLDLLFLTLLASFLAHSLTLKMEAVRSSEMEANSNWAARRHISEE
jgi:hypothetical protein